MEIIRRETVSCKWFCHLMTSFLEVISSDPLSHANPWDKDVDRPRQTYTGSHTPSPLL